MITPSSGDITIETIRTDASQSDFNSLGLSIYTRYPSYGSSLVGLDRKSRSSQGWRTRSWLARVGHIAVARVTAIIDEKDSSEIGYFTDFEALEFHTEAVHQLFMVVREWLSRFGIRALRGPMTPYMGDPRGVLIEGNDSPPCVGLSYAPEYYDNILSDLGFLNEMSLFSYRVDPQRVRSLKKLAKFVWLRHPKASIRSFDTNHVERELTVIQRIYNEAWSTHWQFNAVTGAQIQDSFHAISSFFDPTMACFLQYNEKDIGIFLAIPNIHTPRDDGTSFSGARGMLFGVSSEWQRKGLDVLLLDWALDMVGKKGFDEYEIGWVLESNTHWRRQLEKLHCGAILGIRRFSIYQQPITD